MIILGIETSCDETAISVVEAEGNEKNPSFKVLGSAIHSQADMHSLYGGVYPNLAKREHTKNLPAVLETALEKAKMPARLASESVAGGEISKIDAIAVTVGPGLEPALWTGITFAKELAEKWKKPLIPTNHMEGHLASVLMNSKNFIKLMPSDTVSKAHPFETVHIKFPALGLLISGGHTELVLLKSWTEKEIIGETKDDAVGEAFDKVARMLGLPYPGGPEISKLASEAREQNFHLETKFPRPMIKSGDLNFSFSGLKTAVLYYLRKPHPAPRKASDHLPLDQGKEYQKIAREFEDAVVEVLIEKTKTAIALHNPHTLIIGGGVISNNLIREKFEALVKEYPNMELKIPEKSLTTDNATMIAMAGYLSFITKSAQPELRAQGNLKYL